MSARLLRVGLVGAGMMGAQHAHLLRDEVPGADLVAVLDPDRDRAARLQSSLHDGASVELVDGIPDLLDRVDAVVVASPDATHASLVPPCLEAGKPVLCEKPLATDVAASVRLVEAERATGRALITVGFMRRFDPGYVALRETIHAGELGRPRLIHCVHRNRSSAGPVTSAEVITGSGSHEFDILRWLTGREIVDVSTHAQDDGGPLLLVLRLDDGTVVDVELFVNATYGYEVRCEVVGETGTATLDEVVPVVRRHDGLVARAVPDTWTPRFAEAYRRELTAWVRATTDDRLPDGAATAADGLAASRIAELAVRTLDHQPDGSGRPSW